MSVTTGDIDAAAFTNLKQIARAEKTTIFAVMLSIYFILLNRMTGHEDLALASLFANRVRPEAQSTVGFFANMVVLRTLIKPGDQFIDVVRKVRATAVEALLHQGVPSQMLPLRFQDTDGRVDDLVFQMLLTPPANSNTRARGVEFELYTPDAIGSRFGLELSLVPQQDGRCKAMLFSTEEQFPSRRARDLVDEYLGLAKALAVRPDDRLAVL
jgi:non-ribosomal peptide synthetase component F